jgi:hypothetical protein
MMESMLRDAFCSLVGSKFAAIVAAGQNTTWLIEQCRALTDAHREMPESARDAIKEALKHCASANEKRNELVHAMKTAVTVRDGSFQTIRSRHRNYKPTMQKWTPESLNEAAFELSRSTSELLTAIEVAVGPRMAVIGDALGWEDYYAHGGKRPIEAELTDDASDC